MNKNNQNRLIMFGILSSMILLISLMSMQQTAHATPVITKFGIGYADGKHNAQDTFRSGDQRDASCVRACELTKRMQAIVRESRED